MPGMPLAPRLRKGLARAAAIAGRDGRGEAHSVDALAGIMTASAEDAGEAVAVAALRASGVDLAAVVTGSAGSTPGRGVTVLLEAARREAARRGQSYVGTEHVLLAILAHATDPVTAWLSDQLAGLAGLRGQIWRCLLDLDNGGAWRPDGPGIPWQDAVRLAATHGNYCAWMPAPVADAVEGAVEAAMADEPIPALALAVVGPDGPLHCSVRGYADLHAERPLRIDTPVRIGSVTKLFTAMAICRLAERGRIHLDRPARAYLGAVEMPNDATVRELLTHTAGLPPGKGLRHYREPLPTVAEYYAAEPLSPNARGEWAYSNHGYTLLGQLVEDVTGEPFAEYLDAVVFRPLGMTSTHLHPFIASDQRAIGYAYDNGRLVPVADSAVVLAGAGAAWSTIDDLARLASGLLSGLGSVLDAETLAALLRPQGTEGGQGVGFQLWHRVPDRPPLFGHTGARPGQ